jgi:Ca-activated chloride channel family protein
MESGDSFSLVTFSNRSRTLIPSAPVYDPYALRQLISTITPDGGTNISDGLQDGFAQLERQRGVKRLLLLSDGNANMGISDAGGLRRMAASQVGAGVSVSTMGMGLEYNEDLLAAMADGGGGQYRYIAHPSQLPAMFNEELRQLGAAVAQRATVELDLPEGAQLLEVYGYEAERSGEDCTIFLGDLIAGQSRKVVARVSLPASAAEELKVAAVQLRWADLERGALHELEVGVGARTSEDLTAVQGTWNRASARKATEAQAADLLDQGARSWEQGDQAGSYSQISEAAEMLERQAQALGYLDLQGEAERYRSTNATIQAAPMGSAEGLHNMKSTKEAARAAAR